MRRDYPDRPIICVGAIIWKDDKVLMIRRGKPPRQGEWTLPGGAQELGETLEEALHREILEETGLTIRIAGLIAAVDAIYPDDEGRIARHYSLIDYTCVWEAGEPVPGEDELDIGWFTLADAKSVLQWEKTIAVITQSHNQLMALQA